VIAFAQRWLPVSVVAVFTYAIAGETVGSTAGLVAGAAAALLVLWRRRAGHHASDKRLYVTKGVLMVEPRFGGGPGASFRLEDLDVVLDTKTIRKVVDGDAMLPVVRFTATRVGPEIDTARIIFTSGQERVALDDRFVSHTDAVEWFGKIRVFLRKNGWVPFDEREGADL
jgi:hypothetical protein